SAPKERPKPNTANPLFGKALAGVKDRASSSTPSTAAASDKADAKPALADPPQPEAEAKNDESKTVMDDGEPHTHADPRRKEALTPGWGNPTETGGADSGGAEEDVTGLISNDFQVEVKLADQQADPNSPLYSAKTFEELPLHPDLLKGIYASGFKKPSKIQENALPLLLANPATNLIGQSQSGTGKTAAFSLNMLSRVDPAITSPQAICLAPSRELARQIKVVIDTLGQFTSIKTFLAVPKSWRRGIRITDHILVGTPGTLVDMLGSRVFDPKMIRVFVLDEADEMIQLQGLGDQTFRIKKVLPPEIQNVLFSATFPEEVQEFAQLFAPNANQIYLRKEDITVDAITQLKLECENESAKFDALSALYDVMSIGQSIVFCKRKASADEITSRLVSEGHSVASLHGDKLHDERDKVLDGFRDGKTKVLITTNVVARGIDIQQVNMVVNYDVPDMGPEGNWEPDIETYIHRIGRTGRFGRKGLAVTFIHDDRSRRDVETIQSRLGKPMKRIRVDKDLDALEQVRVPSVSANYQALKAATKSAASS
ncbi:putative ATP-dependent RNA helicase, partial [Cutaneotrichosporon oleaginosum]